MLYIRRAEDRLRTNEDWRESRHTFSFGAHRDPRFDGFRRLRAINDDRIEPGAISPELAHDAEIVSYVVEGALEDSVAGVVDDIAHVYGPVVHRERAVAKTRVIELWLEPERRSREATCEIVHLARTVNELRHIASGRGDGIVALHVDADIFATLLLRGAHVEHALASKRFAWIQVVSGSVRMNGIPLASGDGVAVAEVPAVSLRSENEDAEVMLIDLA